MKRILHLITSLEPDGAQILLLDLVRRLDPKRYEITIAHLLGRSAAAGCPGISVIDLSHTGRPDPLAVPRLVRLIRRRRIDLIHTHLVHAGIAGKLAASLAGGRPVITTRHYAWDHKESTFLYRLENHLTRRCLRVIAVSPAVEAYLIKQRIAPAGKIDVIPNGVDLQLFDPASVTRRVRDHLVIGTVGRLHPQKGQSVLLEAFAIVRAQLPGARLEIAGRGPLLAGLERTAERLGVASDVRFNGRVPHDDLPEALASWDLFVLPSLWEGFGIAAAEAMAMELPVIASRIEGPADLVAEGVTGLLIPPGQPRSLAEAILALAADPARRAEMGRAGRSRIQRFYSIEAAAARLQEVYDLALPAGGRT